MRWCDQKKVEERLKKAASKQVAAERLEENVEDR